MTDEKDKKSEELLKKHAQLEEALRFLQERLDANQVVFNEQEKLKLEIEKEQDEFKQTSKTLDDEIGMKSKEKDKLVLEIQELEREKISLESEYCEIKKTYEDFSILFEKDRKAYEAILKKTEDLGSEIASSVVFIKQLLKDKETIVLDLQAVQEAIKSLTEEYKKKKEEFDFLQENISQGEVKLIDLRGIDEKLANHKAEELEARNRASNAIKEAKVVEDRNCKMVQEAERESVKIRKDAEKAKTVLDEREGELSLKEEQIKKYQQMLALARSEFEKATGKKIINFNF